MLDKKRFLEEYNITEEAFREADIEWEELAKIYESYQKIEGDLRDIGKDFVDDYLYDIEKRESILIVIERKRRGIWLKKSFGNEEKLRKNLRFWIMKTTINILPI